MIILLPVLSCQEQHEISLQGTWRFTMDTADVGIKEQWYLRKLADRIQLPGSMAGNKKGLDISTETQWTGQIIDQSWYFDSIYAPYRQPGNIKIPFWLTPVKHYVGPAWYQKRLTIPEDWQGHPVQIYLERTHWEVMAWLDSMYIGKRNSLGTPNIFELANIEPGTHTLTLRVDNRIKIDVGVNAHSVSDHTQTNWNGLIGKLAVRKKPDFEIRNVAVYPDMKDQSAKIVLEVYNHTGESSNTTLNAVATGEYDYKRHLPPPVEETIKLDPGPNSITARYKLGPEMMTWDEYEPAVYSLIVSVGSGHQYDQCSTVFGMREISIEGTQFNLNGRKIMLRGTLECAIFPITGYPPTSVSAWKKNFKVVKEYGLNHIRFHSWCPPEAAFQAADELGLYLQVECGAWATIGNGEPIDAFIMEESNRIVNAYGNHPSFCLFAYGNEPGGQKQAEYLTDFIHYWKEKDNRRVYTGAAGWPVLEANDYHNIPEPRGHMWGAGLRSRFNRAPLNRNYDYSHVIDRFAKPVVSHEIGQWCVFPDLTEIDDYQGILKAKNFEIVKNRLQQKGMEHQAPDFLMASGKWQALLYKEEIETALRTPGFGGFQLLDLHDFPGQGTALVGVLNPFWKSKGYITGPEFNSFCNAVVPLTRITKVVYKENDRLIIPLEIANYGSDALTSDIIVSLSYPDGTICFEKTISQVTMPREGITTLASIPVDLDQVVAPARLRLAVALEGLPYKNTWNIWVFPKSTESHLPDNAIITSSWDTARIALQNGQKVLLTIPPGKLDSNVPSGFTTIFWNTAWTRRQKPHTLGLLCDPQQPVFSEFPTEYHTDWHWFDVVHHSKPMLLDHLPKDLFPLIQVIDDWNTNRKLGLLFEGRVGPGKLMVSSIDFNAESDQQIVRDQLLLSIMGYMSSEAFDPVHNIPDSAIQNLMKPFNIMDQAIIMNSPPEVPGYEIECAIDQDPETFWHTPWTGSVPAHPHEMEMDLGSAIRVVGFRVLPRQDGITGGMVHKCAIYGRTDDQGWGKPLVIATFNRSMEASRIELEKPVATRYIKFVSLEGFENQAFTSMAEFEVITDN